MYRDIEGLQGPLHGNMRGVLRVWGLRVGSLQLLTGFGTYLQRSTPGMEPGYQRESGHSKH